jgi:hypothetical protein
MRKSLSSLLLTIGCSSNPTLHTIVATAAIPSVSVSIGTVTYACHPQGGNTPTPIAGTGGNNSAGGNIATGGTTPIIIATSGSGGKIGTGGTPGTGGATSPCTTVEPLVPQPVTVQEVARKAKKPHTVMKRHHRKKGRARKTTDDTGPSTVNTCPIDHTSNNHTPLDQDAPTPTGSCTGNAGVGAISTQLFKGTTHYNQHDARLAYQGGTCVDNGCTIPCTCKSCPAAFCPDTNANDNGSNGSSVMAWMSNTDIKWINGYTTADTITDLQTCLNKGSNPVIGIDWWSGMDNPGKGGEIFTTGYIRGGHELRLVRWDGTYFIGINSWGLWGYCLQSQITAATPNDGTGCGFFKITPTTLQKANFDGDCPLLN